MEGASDVISPDFRVDDDLRLYAKWIGNSYGILNLGGGELAFWPSFTYASQIYSSDLPEPTRNGYVFDGWYFDSDYSEPVDEKFIIDEGMTLYAKWNVAEGEEPGEEVEDVLFTYEINNGEVTITGLVDSAPEYIEELSIPGTLEGLPVVAVKSLSRNSHSFGKVTFPNSIEAIGSDLFSGMTSLRDVELPASLTVIPNGMFFGCSSLTSIDIPQTVESIGNSAFSSTGLVEVSLPKSVTRIGTSVFSGCMNLVSVNSFGGLAYMESYMFRGCESLELVIPPQIMLCNTDSLKGVKSVVVESREEIPDHIFSSSAVSSVVIEDGVEIIGTYAFQDNESLVSVTLPDTVREIQSNAFDDCINLQSINFPEDLEIIGVNAFANTNLKRANFKANLKTISNSAFFTCNNLSEVTFSGEKLVAISAYAFRECTSLTSIDLPEGLVNIHLGAFQSSALSEITLPESLNVIGSNAFSDCKNLASLVIPRNAIQVGDEIISGCSSLSEVVVHWEETPDWWGLHWDDGFTGTLTKNTEPSEWNEDPATWYSYERTSNGIKILGASEELSEFQKVFHVPNAIDGHPVVEIADEAFIRKDLIEVTLPQTIKIIGGSAFSNNEECKIKVLTDDLVSVGVNAFNYVGKVILEGNTIKEKLFKDTEITDVYVNVSAVPDYAFDGCYDLVSVAFGPSVRSVGKYLFDDSEYLESIIVEDGMEQVGDYAFKINSPYKACTIVLPDSIKSMGQGVFAGLWINSIRLPSSMTRIENRTFEDVALPEDFAIPDGIVEIGDWAFDSCSFHYEGVILTLPDSLETIEADAFYNAACINVLNIPASVTNVGRTALDIAASDTFTPVINLPFKENEKPAGWDDQFVMNRYITLNYAE